ncbi:MAG: hypothetical protein HY609_06140 [Deltaproteobacteria bacterium]|nr:hypothetical protein [Deltaproteobacteria bacterium]MBI4224497.1 hypothetical protein [Deltaproteobacteria bacterium]
MKKTLSLIVILSLALAACHNRRVFQEADDGLGLDDGATRRSGGGGGGGGGDLSLPPPGPPVFVVESIRTHNEAGDLLNSRSFEYNENGFLVRDERNDPFGVYLTTSTYTYLEDNIVAINTESNLPVLPVWVEGCPCLPRWQLDASGRIIEDAINGAAGPVSRTAYEYPDNQSRYPSSIRFFEDADHNGSADSAPYFEVSYTFDEQHRPLTQTFSGGRNESRTWEFDTHGRVQKIRIERQEGDRMIHDVVLFTNVFYPDGTLRGQNIQFNRGGVRIHSSTIEIVESDSAGRITTYLHDFEGAAGAAGGADGTTDHNTYITYVEVPQQLWPYDIVPDIQEELLWGGTALSQIPGF